MNEYVGGKADRKNGLHKRCALRVQKETLLLVRENQGRLYREANLGAGLEGWSCEEGLGRHFRWGEWHVQRPGGRRVLASWGSPMGLGSVRR